ncbi:non-specific lipid-transfer protein-like protein At2g13820 isoform X1 [Herrania umbratica]|uniref:Non-specific lipid-transfer protein-like protein At2g13820 isoform X1 n=1 Tax=Herrania umbratica TaxID=108875 RepID=A0A6J1AYE3_9ROSI|nr:non-specific lipid-transfer protein-like protein At2g13820 isoform X1 [Herrania umbratica]
MASRKITGGLVLLLVAMLCTRTMAQSDCTSVLITMAPCLNYVTGSSSTPSASCCSQLANVVQSQPQCLCMALNGGGASLGVSINQTLALALPVLCNVKTPPVSKCNAADGPATAISPFDSPASSPQGLPGGSADTPSSSSASGGSKTVPATSSEVIIKMPIQLILFLLPIALYASISSNF